MKKFKKHPNTQTSLQVAQDNILVTLDLTADQRKMKLRSYQPTLLHFTETLHSDLYFRGATAGLLCLEAKPTTSGYSAGRSDSV